MRCGPIRRTRSGVAALARSDDRASRDARRREDGGPCRDAHRRPRRLARPHLPHRRPQQVQVQRHAPGRSARRGVPSHAGHPRHRRQPARSHRRQGPRRHALRLRHARQPHPPGQHGGGRALDAERRRGQAALRLGQPRPPVPHRLRPAAAADGFLPAAKARAPSCSSGAPSMAKPARTPRPTTCAARWFELFDQAGVVTSDDYDFKGNLLRSQRQLAAGVQDHAGLVRRRAARSRDLHQPHPLRRAQPPDPVDRAAQRPARHHGQRHSADLQRGQPAGAGARLAQPERRACGLARSGHREPACGHGHRLRRQGPAHADRLRQRRQDDLRLRPADLPPGASAHPARRRRLSRRLPAAAAGRLARLPGAEPALHLRPGGQHHPHPRRRAADDLLPQQARRAERRLHLRRRLPADRSHRPRAPGAGRRRRRSRTPTTTRRASASCCIGQRRQRDGALPRALRLRRGRQLPARCSIAAAIRRTPAGRAPTPTTSPACSNPASRATA